MKYNFDETIDRCHTDALKIDAVREDLLPMWVADMDFKTPDFIMDALADRCKHPIIGYTVRTNVWHDAIVNWCKSQYSWIIKRENIGFVSGIVNGIANALHCFVKPGSKVMILPPVYHPFRMIVKADGCEVVNCKLLIKNERYYIDYDSFEKHIKDCKALIFCNPHNPGGRVWSLDELRHISEICNKYNILVISDEIHCDLTYPEFKHIPYATVSEEAAQNSITFMAPSKTFNCAGLSSSQYIILNKSYINQFAEYLESNEFNMGHVFAYFPAVKGFTQEGKEWISELLQYVEGNVKYIYDFINRHMPKVKIMIPEASFLVFIDFRGLGFDHDKLVDFIKNKAKLALNDGEMFGPGGEGFMRMNVGTPRANIVQAMKQLYEDYNSEVINF